MFEMQAEADEPDRAALHRALDEALDARRGDPGPALGEAIEAAHRVTMAVDGALVEAVSSFESSMAWAVDGTRTPVARLVTHTGLPRRAAAGLRRTCVDGARMPHVAAAARSGQLPASHLQLLTRARREEVAEIFDQDEAELVEAARSLTADGLRMHLAAWYHGALRRAGANEPDKPPRNDSERTTCNLSGGFAGRGLFDGELTPQDFAALRGAIDGVIDGWFRDGCLAEDPRSRAELQGDALVDLVNRGAGRSEDVAVRPSVVAIVDIDTLLDRSDLSDDERTARRAELLGVGPVPDRTIRELATRAHLSVLITDRDGWPLWLGRDRRLATPAQRKAVLAAQGHCCAWGSCEVPASRLEIDHVDGWEAGGGTDIDNLIGLCQFHNRLKHRGGYRAIRGPDGAVEIRGPDGHRVTSPYHHRRRPPS